MYDLNFIVNQKLNDIKETKIVNFLLENADKKETYCSEQELVDKIFKYSEDFKEKHSVFNYLIINKDNKLVSTILEKNIGNLLLILSSCQNLSTENNSIILFNPDNIIVTEVIPPEVKIFNNNNLDINYYIEIEKQTSEYKIGEIIVYDRKKEQ
jgi:hypothetical protein